MRLIAPLASVLAFLLAWHAAPARAQYPDHAIRMVIPYPPGGSNDIVGRLVSEGMGARLGQPLVIDNRGGAGGMLGSEVVAKAPPDGYTILLGGSGSVTIASLVHARPPFDAANGFAPIGLIGVGPNVIVVHPGVAAHTLRELQAVARSANPSLSYATPGVGSTDHLAGVLLAQAFGVELEHAPYRGTGPALNDVLAGRVPLFINALAPLAPHIEAGTLRPLAIAGAHRTAALPNVPTTAEAGFPAMQSATWFGLLAPAGTPPARVQILHAALNATLAEPDVLRRLREGGVDPEPSASPAEFAAYFAADRARWTAVVARAGIAAAQALAP